MTQPDGGPPRSEEPILYVAEGLEPTQARVHVLLIGVGEYLYLPDGPNYDRENPPSRTFSLANPQLTSPPLSAAALADWFLTKHYNPDTPLGSVELLLSPNGYTPIPDAAQRLGVEPGGTVTVASATFDSIKRAAGRWFDRLNELRDNIGLFYFCGHGLEATDRYLLAADFCGDPMNLDHGIINFEKTFTNMQPCQASTQCFLLDACRDTPSELAEAAAHGDVGRPIIDPRRGPRLGRNGRIYHAAAPGKPAAGPHLEKSYFAGALLDCLNGMGGRVGGDRRFFSIDDESLGRALQEHVDRIAESHDFDFACRTDGSNPELPGVRELHLAEAPVDVLTTIFCRPPDADLAAELLVMSENGEFAESRPAKCRRPWRLTLRSGRHKVSATFGEGTQYFAHSAEITVDVVPTPIFSVPVRIRT